jgi:hypothetical protein
MEEIYIIAARYSRKLLYHAIINCNAKRVMFIQTPNQGDTRIEFFLKKLQSNLILAAFSELTTLSHPSASCLKTTFAEYPSTTERSHHIYGHGPGRSRKARNTFFGP